MKNMQRLNVFFFKLWILLAILFGSSGVISLFVAPPVISKWLGLCFVWSLIGVTIGVFFNKLTRRNE
jgi:uncharacterized membrane protein YraQ (UPF0718 family)